MPHAPLPGVRDLPPSLRRPHPLASLLLGATLALGFITLPGCQSTPASPTGHRVDYVGPGTFRWGSYQGYSLISLSPSGYPQIRTDGSFTQEDLRLVLTEDNQTESAGQVLPLAYIPAEGDAITVHFASFPRDGRVEITRRHCGIDYLQDRVETRRDGLEVVGHAPVPLRGDPDPGDIINFGHAFFQQRPGIDLEHARCRFFAAGLHYPELAMALLRQYEERAEEERNAVLGQVAFTYRARFELIQEVAAEHHGTDAEPSDPPADETPST